MARPSKYSPERERIIVEALKACNTEPAAAELAGIDYSTFKRWQQRYAPFCAAVKKARAEAQSAMVNHIAEAAKNGSWQAAAWLLERRNPDEWGRRDRVDFTIRKEAERLAGQLGLDAQELVREAERIIAGRS